MCQRQDTCVCCSCPSGPEGGRAARLNQVALKSEGMISMRPSLTAAHASAAMPPHDTHHCTWRTAHWYSQVCCKRRACIVACCLRASWGW